MRKDHRKLRRKQQRQRDAAERRSQSRYAARHRRIERRARSEEMAAVDLAKKDHGYTFRCGTDGAWVPNIARFFTGYITTAESVRLTQVLNTVEARAGKLMSCSADKFRVLAVPEWIRPIETWKVQGKGKRTTFRSLVNHLLVAYRMPPFLYTAFEGFWPQIEKSAALFAFLAKGGSVAKAVEEQLIPVPLTKRMCHEFMQAREGTPILQAVRRAQVKCYGGSGVFADTVADSCLGQSYYPHEDFIASVLQWFCGQGMIHGNHFGPMIDYLLHMRRNDPTYSLRGRTFQSVQRHMETWHRELGRGRFTWGWNPVSKDLPKSGFKSAVWERSKQLPSGDKIPVKWGMEEILTVDDLQEEGRRMRHCVVSYGPRIERGVVSIWSLWNDDGGVGKCLTVEVSNAQRTIVQARGSCNRRPTPEEDRVLFLWAQHAGLRIDERLI